MNKDCFAIPIDLNRMCPNLEELLFVNNDNNIRPSIDISILSSNKSLKIVNILSSNINIWYDEKLNYQNNATTINK
jgi:hypothetical protein